jgi:hypothetical protein
MDIYLYNGISASSLAVLASPFAIEALSELGPSSSSNMRAAQIKDSDPHSIISFTSLYALGLELTAVFQ